MKSKFIDVYSQNKIIYLREELGIKEIGIKIVISRGKKLVVYIFENTKEFKDGIKEYDNSQFCYLCHAIFGLRNEIQAILEMEEAINV